MIKLFGHSMVSIDDIIVIDPHDGGSIGLSKPSLTKANIVLITHDHFDHNAYQIIESEDVKIGYLGEFRISKYKVRSFRANHDQQGGKERGKTSIYEVNKEGVSFVHMGDIGEIPSKILKEISPDVLALPIGGTITIDWSQAIEVIKELSPSIVIPLHYWIKGHLMPLDPPNEFLKNINYKQFITREVDETRMEKGIYLFQI